MNKEQFLKSMRKELSRLPKAELDEIIADYQEYFHDGMASGRSEEEIARALGDPKKLARELLAQQHIDAWKADKSIGNLMRVVLAVAALGSLNLFLAIPMLAFMAVLTVSYACSMALIVIGIVFALSLIPGFSSLTGLNGNIVIGHDSKNASLGIQLMDDYKAGDGQRRGTLPEPPDAPEATEPPEPDSDIPPITPAPKGHAADTGVKLGIGADITGDDGSVVHIERKDGQIIRREIHGKNGDKVLIERDEKGNEHVRIEGADGDRVVIDRHSDKRPSSVQIHDAKGQDIHIEGLGGITRTQAQLAGAAIGIVGGGLWLWLNMVFTRLVFRGFVRYVRLNASIIRGHAGEAREAAHELKRDLRG
ncbi:DUF1700 domain-containing protein [Chitinivorax sp. PXF-14]|uniref:DUF1700 domain-containing protein n=1 Tax=Chitinivorax sp. PXF-14 TaxID=3230488 RepID=UPI003467AC5F